MPVLVGEGELGNFVVVSSMVPIINELGAIRLPRPDPHLLQSRAFRTPVRAGFQVWGGSSVGRASRSQCEGRGFDPLPLHQ